MQTQDNLTASEFAPGHCYTISHCLSKIFLSFPGTHVDVFAYLTAHTCINTIIHIKELTTHYQPVHVVDGWVCRRSHPLAIKGNPTSRVMAVEPRLYIVSCFDSKSRLSKMMFAQVHLYFRVHLSFSTNLTYRLVRVWIRSSAIATRQFQMAVLVFSKTWQLSHLRIS